MKAFEDSQLAMRGLLGRMPENSACVSEASSDCGMPPVERANTNCSNDLLERIAGIDNLREACEVVASGKGSVRLSRDEKDKVRYFFSGHASELSEQISKGKYEPQPRTASGCGKQVSGKRQKYKRHELPELADVAVRQAVYQVVAPLFGCQYNCVPSKSRANYRAHDALHAFKRYVEDGYAYTVRLSFEDFTGEACKSRIAQLLSEKVHDGRVVSLCHRYLNAGVMECVDPHGAVPGVHRVDALVELFADVLLGELDAELARRGHKFVRVGGDMVVFCKSHRAAERVCESTRAFASGKLHICESDINSYVCHFTQAEFLGYGFNADGERCRFRVHSDSVKAMRGRVRELTARSNAVPNEQRPLALSAFVRGWTSYFALADMKGIVRKTDVWAQRRIRMCLWKQWKLVRTRFAKLRKLGLAEKRAFGLANTRKGYWHAANDGALRSALSARQLRAQGYLFFSDCYGQFRAC